MARTLTAEPTDPFTPDFDTLVEGLLQEFHVPGLSIAVVHGDETFTKDYGYSQVKSLTAPSRPWTPKTLLGTASTTKAFTSLALAQIVHANMSCQDGSASIGEKGSSSPGPITWQTPVSTLLPGDFVLPTRELTDAVTIEDILCHRTGLPSCDNACLSWGAGAHADTPASVTRKLRYFPLPPNTTLATLRTRHIYSNTMYAAAQHLIETLRGEPLRKVFRERIFDVLGMQRTFFGFHDIEERRDDTKADTAKGYRWLPDGRGEAAEAEGNGKYVQIHWQGSPEQGAAGDIVSCVSDYAFWMRALLSQDSRILSEEGWKEVMRPRVVVENNEDRPDEERRKLGPETYALGWSKYQYWGEEIVMHTGVDPGIGTLVHLLPAQKYGIAIFANTSDTSGTIARIVSMLLTDDLLQVPAAQRIDFADLARAEAAKQSEEETHKNFEEQSLELFPETDEEGATEYPKLQLGLPLSACAGRYHHGAYGVINVQVMKLGQVRRKQLTAQPRLSRVADEVDDLREVLFIALNDRTFPGELVLLHHNAGFFVVEEWDTLESELVDWLRAEVRIGVGGEVVAIGIGFAADDGVEGYIWFHRIREKP